MTQHKYIKDTCGSCAGKAVETGLDKLDIGKSGTVCALYASGSMRRRLLDIGLIENTEVECVGRSPLGDPSAYLIRGAVIAIRSEDCKDIIVHAH